jgi:hypothetical protein
MWPDALKVGPDFDRIAAKPFAVQFAVHASNITGEWKPSVVGLPANDSDCASVDSMIEGIAKVAGGVLDDGRKVAGELGSQSDLVNLLSSIGINVDHQSVRLAVHERFDLSRCVINVLASAVEKRH